MVCGGKGVYRTTKYDRRQTIFSLVATYLVQFFYLFHFHLIATHLSRKYINIM